jgi:flagellar basal body-associated protein FliL
VELDIEGVDKVSVQDERLSDKSSNLSKADTIAIICMVIVLICAAIALMFWLRHR